MHSNLKVLNYIINILFSYSFKFIIEEYNVILSIFYVIVIKFISVIRNLLKVFYIF